MKEITIRFIDVYEYLLSIDKVSNSSDFAKAIGISTSMMNEITKGRSNVGVKAIQNTVSKFKEISIDWLITGKGKMHKKFEIKELANNPDEELAIKTYGIPLLPIDAFGGIANNDGYTINLSEIEDRYVVPLFDDIGVDFLIKIKGQSMSPHYCSGDIVACKFVKELLFIQWNRTYVIDTKSQGALIKKILPSENENSIVCRSYNIEFLDFDLPKSDITNIALVVGLIRLE